MGFSTELCECLITKPPSFMLHQHFKGSQSKAYNQLKQSFQNNNSLARFCWKLLYNLAVQDPISTMEEEVDYTVDKHVLEC